MGLFDIFKSKPAQKVVSTNVVDHVKSGEYFRDTSLAEDRNHFIVACNKSANGLLPHEILMLAYAHKFKASNNSFQNFWYSSYGVKDPQAILQKLVRDNFIVLGGADTALSGMKVSDLKDLLARHGLSTTGKKEILISRLLENVSSSILLSELPPSNYVLTPKGSSELLQNEYVLYIHNHQSYEIPMWQMNKWITDNPKQPWRDHIWAEFNRRCFEYSKRRTGGYYRNNRLNMYSFSSEEGRLNDALSLLAEVVFLDVAVFGVGAYLAPGNKDSLAQRCKLSPGITKELEKTAFQLSMNSDALFKYLHSEFSQLGAFVSMWVNGKMSFSAEDAAGLVVLQLDRNVSGYEAICASYEKKLKK